MKAKAIVAILGVPIIAVILTHLFDQRRFRTAENRDRDLLGQQQEQAKADRNQSILALNARDLEIAGLRKEVSDTPRLRNEISQLRQQVADARWRSRFASQRSHFRQGRRRVEVGRWHVTHCRVGRERNH
jgi:hypothetical protein